MTRNSHDAPQSIGRNADALRVDGLDGRQACSPRSRANLCLGRGTPVSASQVPSITPVNGGKLNTYERAPAIAHDLRGREVLEGELAGAEGQRLRVHGADRELRRCWRWH